jgi:adenine-specific DNA-methyltransferase
MNRFTSKDPETKSADSVAGNLEYLQARFPEACVEGRVDFEVLKQLLGGPAEERDERYGLNWHGKRRARQLALTPSTGTLRPCPADSEQWDSTQNLMIEGDNLEVLKLLQKSYSGKVGVIYIDPPYNTGKDFVYPDDFQHSIANYLELTGQKGDSGTKLSSNTETSGRFHTDWLNMMYPRLKLARDLLTSDGVMLISLDAGEVHNCRAMAGELFGAENYVATFVWVSNLKGRQISDGGPVGTHEYILCYARDAERVGQFQGSIKMLKEMMPSVYKNLDYELRHDARGAYVVKNELYNTNSKFNEKTAPTMVFDIHHNFATGETKTTEIAERAQFPGFEVAHPHPNARSGISYHAWRWSRDKVVKDAADLEFVNDRGRLRISTKIRDVDRTALKDIVIGPSTGTGQADLENLGLARVFDTPKPVELIQVLLASASRRDAVVLDFFSGSGTTAHAVMAQNAADGGSRRYLVVQLPEPLDPGNEGQSAAAEFCDKIGKPRTLAEVTKERLRRAAKAVTKAHAMFAGDLGFRAFKLDSSNIRTWEPTSEDLPKTLFESVEHLKKGRTEQDILYEVLLKLGLDLCVPIEARKITGKDVHSVGGGVLMTCLADRIAREEVEVLAQGIVDWHEVLAPTGDTTCVFRDSAFADDVAKTNMAAILNQHGLANVRSL